jgi:hypothetical protein
MAPIQNAAGLLDAFVSQIADGGVIQFSAPTYSVAENAGSLVVAVQRTGDVSGGATVEFRTSDGTATAGADYHRGVDRPDLRPGPGPDHGRRADPERHRRRW